MKTKPTLEVLLVALLALALGVSAAFADPSPPSGSLTLIDEAGNPLANYPSDYPTETRNLTYKYRCGGEWAPEVSFQTDVNGQFPYNADCSAYPGQWDNKISVTLNQTSLEQDVTVNATFQAAKVNANLKSCTGPITATPGGSVDQGGGYWYHHGDTGPSGTVTFYTFPGSIKVRMGYNHNNEERVPVVIASGTNNVDFQTTELTINYAGDIRSNKGGSWWMFSKPSMDLLPGDYPFYFKTDSIWDGRVTISVSGCEMVYPPPSTNTPPTVLSAAADASGNEGSLLTTSGSFTDPDSDALTIAGVGAGSVTDNGNGTWSWNYTPTDNGTGSVTVTADDGKGGTVTDTFDWTAYNVAPSATFNTPASVSEGSMFNISLTGAADPSSLDTAAGFTYAFNCGGGYGAFGPSNTATCTAGLAGTLTVKGQVKDKDGGAGEYTANVTVLSSNQVKVEIGAKLQNLLPTGDKKSDEHIGKAIEHIGHSLKADLWADGSHLTKKGKKVFDEEKKAVKELQKVETVDVSSAIAALVAVDKVLAQTAIAEVTCGGDKCQKELDKANEEMGKAAAELPGDPDKAIEHYKKAWEHAMKAMDKAVE